MFKPPRRRLYRLSAWLIRALIPQNCIGTYTLFTKSGQALNAFYIGRSDTCLRRRLISHASHRKAHYFDYQVQWTAEKAFIAECAAYHALADATANIIHPAHPKGKEISCPFCRSVFEQIRQNRLKCFPDRVDLKSMQTTTPLNRDKLG